jgi:hypothetical protein
LTRRRPRHQRKAELLVLEKRCNECLFSKNKIVSDKRRDDLLEGCKRRGSHFVCHKASNVKLEAVCRGFYDSPEHPTRLIHVARVLRAVRFVKEEDLEKVAKEEGT